MPEVSFVSLVSFFRSFPNSNHVDQTRLRFETNRASSEATLARTAWTFVSLAMTTNCDDHLRGALRIALGRHVTSGDPNDDPGDHPKGHPNGRPSSVHATTDDAHIRSQAPNKDKPHNTGTGEAARSSTRQDNSSVVGEAVEAAERRLRVAVAGDSRRDLQRKHCSSPSRE